MMILQAVPVFALFGTLGAVLAKNQKVPHASVVIFHSVVRVFQEGAHCIRTHRLVNVTLSTTVCEGTHILASPSPEAHVRKARDVVSVVLAVLVEAYRTYKRAAAERYDSLR